ncbi:MAG: tRNA 2-thiouridine(34) synthase MnmA [Proteobacteria bacterium]|nr:tRNA 2-thiouridine(34) synthase MnmA [Pseudomonadota bacterium]
MYKSWLAPSDSRSPDQIHVVVAMSGGVDSSVAALMLKEAGFNCSALFMKNWDEMEDQGTCQWEEDVADALQVCDMLEIPLNTVDLSKNYWDLVFKDLLDGYKLGRTPNPDVLCNREIKFKAFADEAFRLGGDFIATGHYVQSIFDGQKKLLLRGDDPQKDQSYFLHTLDQEQLKKALFPVGHLKKEQVRELAKKAGIKVHDKKDSTGICFIGERDFRQFLSKYIPSEEGHIIDTAGNKIGLHQGAALYTIGQRKGLGIGGIKNATDEPWFVVEKNLAKNELTVAQGTSNPALLGDELTLSEISWVNQDNGEYPKSLLAKIRYRQPDQKCLVSKRDGPRYEVSFEQKQRSIAPGQSIVFYEEDVCLGGGIIEISE